MTIPTYDQTILPCFTLPMKNTKESTKKYLGGVAITGEVYMTIKVHPENDTQANALYDFWATDCNFGLEPFLGALPIFGFGIDNATPNMLMQFQGDFVLNKNSAIWEAELKLRLIGTIDYIVDGNGDFIVSDTGEYTVDLDGNYIPTGNQISEYRDVIRKVIY